MNQEEESIVDRKGEELTGGRRRGSSSAGHASRKGGARAHCAGRRR
jgi:hypothetical protein